MPTLTQTVQVEQTVSLTTKQQLALRKLLQKVELNRKKIKGLDAEVKEAVGSVEDILAELGVEELDFEGYKSKIVAGVRKKFDPELFVKKGGNLKLYNEAFVEVPVSAYVKVSVPSDKGDD